MRLAPAVRIGPYEVVSLIGAGGMGEVYQAHDTRLDRIVAIKILRQPDPVARARFGQEARAICSLNHPFICNLYDVGQQDGLDYIVMEFVKGEVLEAILKRAPLSYDTILLIAARIAEALAAAHARGIVHRDLKPGNIMVTKSGLKLLDFGLAKTVLSRSSTDTTQISITRENGISGTLHYMAPEVLEGSPPDTRSDIFAFGAVLYEMASGKPAFSGDSQARVVAAILERRPAALRELVPSIPPAFEHLVAACLEKDLDQRWQSARDLQHALASLQQGGTGGAPPALPERQTAPRRWLRWTLVPLTVATAGVLGFLLHSVPQPPLFHPFTFSGQDFSPTTSPDGKLVAFVSARGGHPAIWLKDLQHGNERRLVEATDAAQPRFSPDGTSLLYRNGTALYRADILGGAIRKVLDAGFGTDSWPSAGGTWSPDGQQIAFARQTQSHFQIVIAGANGENPHAIHSGTTPIGPLRWSPDGKTIVAMLGAVTSNVRPGRYLVMDQKGANQHVISSPPGGFAVSSPAFCSRDQIFYSQALAITGAAAVASSGSRFVRQNIFSGKYTIVGRLQEASRALDIAAPGTVVLESDAARQNLVEFPMDAKAAPPAPVLLGTAQDRQPVYSPDGAWILFTSSRSGNPDLWKLSRATGELRRVTDYPGQDWDPAFTPDGTQILWSCERSGNLEIWTSDADGAAPRQITHDGFDAENPGLAADGWVFYVTANPKAPGLWKVRLDGTDARQVVSGRCTFPDVSPDGRYIAFVYDAGRTVVLETTTGKEIWSMADSESGRTRWTPDGRQLVFHTPQGMMRQDVVPGKDTRETRRVIEISGNPETWDVSPDGKRIVVSLQEGSRSLIVVTGLPGISPAWK